MKAIERHRKREIEKIKPWTWKPENETCCKLVLSYEIKSEEKECGKFRTTEKVCERFRSLAGEELSFFHKIIFMVLYGKSAKICKNLEQIMQLRFDV